MKPYDFHRTVALSAAAYPQAVRDGRASGTPHAVDASEIEDQGLELTGNYHLPDTDTEFYLAVDRWGNLYIVIRGTTCLKDWKQNLRTSLVPWNACVNPIHDLDAGLVHAGHYEALRSIAHIILPEIEKLPRGATVKVTGHSLGGSVANQAAVALAARFASRQIIAPTIAACRSGNATFVDFACSLPNLTIRRYFHRLIDTVAYIPPLLWGYRHLPGIDVPRWGGHLVSSYQESAAQILDAHLR
jgi:hypothetical protein